MADPVSEIVYTYDFLSQNNIIPAGAPVAPERYKVIVFLEQDVHFDEDDDRPYFFLPFFSGKSVRVRIEYVDYAIARALLAAVREWVASLPLRKTNPYLISIAKASDSIRSILPRVVAALSIIGCYKLLVQPSAAYGIVKMAEMSSYAIALAVCFYGFVDFATEQLIKSTFYLREKTYILLTKGDENRRLKQIVDRAKQKRRLSFFFGSIVLVVLLNVASTFLYDKIRESGSPGPSSRKLTQD